MLSCEAKGIDGSGVGQFGACETHWRLNRGAGLHWAAECWMKQRIGGLSEGWIASGELPAVVYRANRSGVFPRERERKDRGLNDYVVGGFVMVLIAPAPPLGRGGDGYSCVPWL